MTHPNSCTFHDLFCPPSQKLAFMVSLGLVTHDHLEGRKSLLGWLFSSWFHGHSELKVEFQNISCIKYSIFLHNSTFGMSVLLI